MKKEHVEILKQNLPYLKQIQGFVESLAEVEQEAFDNLSERAQESEKGEAMEERAGYLEDAASSLEDAIGMIEDAINT